MENIERRRNYLFTDPYLYQLCNEKIVIIGRDFHKIISHGITPAILSELSSRNTAFKDLPSEYELSFRVEEATAAKSYLAAQIRTAIRTIYHRLNSQNVALPAAIQTLEKPCLEQLPDADLLSFARVLTQTILPLLPQLHETGLTPAMLTTLTAICQDFNFSIEKLRKTVSDCEIINAERVKIGNQIYEELMALCSKGKQLWDGINDARYNDYVIHNTYNWADKARSHQ